MGTYLWIAIGSAIGGVTRHWCTDVSVRLLGATFPFGTLFINVLGSFIIGLFFTLAGVGGRLAVSDDVKAFVMVGFCGGYTTFSAFSLQTLALMQAGDWVRAGTYILGSVLLCLIAVWLGHLLGSMFSGARMT